MFDLESGVQEFNTLWVTFCYWNFLFSHCKASDACIRIIANFRSFEKPLLRPIHTEYEHQCCNNTMILFSLKTMESLKNGFATHFGATTLFSIRAVFICGSKGGARDVRLTSLQFLSCSSRQKHLPKNMFLPQTQGLPPPPSGNLGNPGARCKRALKRTGYSCNAFVSCIPASLKLTTTPVN